jgi:DNA-binding transcriptional ArsR family regulator
MKELIELQSGCFLLDAESAVDCPDHHDVPSFIEYVRKMDAATFTFYLIGRVISIEQIKRVNHDVDKIMKQVSAYYEGRKHSFEVEGGLRDAISNVASYQTRLTAMWEYYWNTLFKDEVPALASHWESAIAEKERILSRDGGQALMELLTSHHYTLPDALPPDRPTTEIDCVPVFFITPHSYHFFGYGNVTILFDSERTEARVMQANRAKDEALEVTRALGDSTRLNILRLIAQHGEKMHGKKIASSLNLSPSAVSRQLAQLRDSGLLTEEHHGDQTVTYRLNQECLTSLPDKILNYLFS